MAVIVSTSGIPHHDVGNYTKASFYEAGMPRGMPDHPTWPDSIDNVIGRISDEQPDAVLHTGDMVSGRWGVDMDRPKAGVFGPTDTIEQKRLALLRAGDLYYRQNRSWWTRNGLTFADVVYPAMGDHEYGNLEIDGQPRPNQYAWVDDWRQVWHDQFMVGRSFPYRLDSGQQRHSCYGVMLPGQVGLVTLDNVVADDGLLKCRVGGPQEAWLVETLETLRGDGARWLVVQTEAPMRGPNRKVHSSGLILRNGDAIWQHCVDLGVDLVLASEFHAITTWSNGGRRPVQVVHGGQLYRGNASYLRIDVLDDRLEIRAKEMLGTTAKPAAFWAPHELRAPGVLQMPTGTSGVGSATLTEAGDLIDRVGFLTEGID